MGVIFLSWPLALGLMIVDRFLRFPTSNDQKWAQFGQGRLIWPLFLDRRRPPHFCGNNIFPTTGLL
jgi:hypothetical protein